MAKKKKAKKVRKVKKLGVRSKGVGRKAKKVLKKKKNGKKKPAAKKPVVKKIKALGKVDHYYDKISVAAVKMLGPLKVGDIVQIKGHTTDFFQRIDSIQINHQEVTSVKKGDDIGVKVKDYVRQNDLVLPATEKDLLAQPVKAQPVKQTPPKVVTPMFQTSIFKKEEKPMVPKTPQIAPNPATPSLPRPEAKKADPYSNTKFMSF
ncbi:MAG: hypothetical protein ABIH50_01215 [bacterium]